MRDVGEGTEYHTGTKSGGVERLSGMNITRVCTASTLANAALSGVCNGTYKHPHIGKVDPILWLGWASSKDPGESSLNVLRRHRVLYY